MAIIVEQADVVDGGSFNWEQTSGITVTRKFIVSGIEGNPAARQYLAATAPSIPSQGDEHPDILKSYVQNISVNMLGASTAEVLVNYSTYRASSGSEEDKEKAYRSKRISASVQSVDTNFYYDDNNEKQIIEVQYDWTGGNAPATALKGPIDKQVGTVKKEVPTIVMEISRIEKSDPFNKILKYKGKINSVAWARGAKHQWLIRDIDSITQDEGVTFTVTYRFQFLDETWNPPVAYIDERTGKPPSDVGKKNGDRGLNQESALKQPRIYEEIDFKKLGLGG